MYVRLVYGGRAFFLRFERSPDHSLVFLEKLLFALVYLLICCLGVLLIARWHGTSVRVEPRNRRGAADSIFCGNTNFSSRLLAFISAAERH